MDPNSNYSTSNFGLLFGEDVDGDGQSYSKFKLQINKSAANQQAQYLNTSTNFQIDVNWSLVIAIKSNPEQKAKIVELLEQIFNTDPEKPSEIHSGIRQLVKDGGVFHQIASSADTVFLSIKLPQDFEDQVVEPFMQFMPMGLEKIAQTQENTVEGVLKTNIEVSQLISSLKAGEKLVSVLFKNLRAEGNLKFHNDFGNDVKQILDDFDPEFANSPPIIFLRYFQLLDLDFRFFSTEELPEDIRKTILPGPKWSKGEDSQEVEYSLFKELIFNLDSTVKFYYTVKDFAAFECECVLPGWSEFFVKLLAGQFSTSQNSA